MAIALRRLFDSLLLAKEANGIKETTFRTQGGEGRGGRGGRNMVVGSRPEWGLTWDGVCAILVLVV